MKYTFFGQPVNIDKRTNDNIQKITNGRRDNHAPGCQLDYAYFKEHYTIIAIDLSKEQILDADPKGIQQINCSWNL